jgi:predicted AlkP superfamily phosphohydrolase/phosphomutase
MSRHHAAPVLMIALDAAEPELLERWMDDGSLPNLKRLRAGGAYGRLASTADWLAGSPWPSFYTGTTPAEHGLYQFLQWRAEQMTFCRPSAAWLPVEPFWRGLTDSNRRVVAIDMPMTFPPKPFNGVEISGWATHDLLAPPCSYPFEILDWVRRQFGRSSMTPEVYGPQKPAALLGLRDELVRLTHRVAELGKILMQRERWDLFMIGFGATHRGGHKLWDHSGVAGEIDAFEQAELSHALKDIYVACDEAVGHLIDAAQNNWTIIVFSLHGMGPNTSRADLLPAMLERVLSPAATCTRKSQSPSYFRRLLGLVPPEWRHSLKLRLPLAVQDRLTAAALLGDGDWVRAPAFSLIADIQGYIRINLRGREANGMVEPGADYDRLCTSIAQGLSSFVDADTGEAVVDGVVRTDQLFPETPRRNNLPDIVVRWTDSPASRHRQIISSRYGAIPWPTPGRNPDGRSGDHRSEGFLIATGKAFEPDSRINNAHILQLAPTVFDLLDVPKPAQMRDGLPLGDLHAADRTARELAQ